jgi:hypothetical protein
MPTLRTITLAVLGLRVAYGAALAAAPARTTRAWLGPAAAADATQVPVRGVGAREIAVHGAALAAALRGEPLRPWLLASLAGDLGDIAATALGRAGVPAGALPKTAAVAGASALATAGIAAAVER